MSDEEQRMSDIYEREQKIVELFIDSAKTYTQLSTGALILSITFIREILGQKETFHPDSFLIASWICFLIAIGAGATYQVLAIKYLEKQSNLPRAEQPISLFESLIDYPGKVYGLMMIAFYLGAAAFTIVAIKRMYPQT